MQLVSCFDLATDQGASDKGLAVALKFKSGLGFEVSIYPYEVHHYQNRPSMRFVSMGATQGRHTVKVAKRFGSKLAADADKETRRQFAEKTGDLWSIAQKVADANGLQLA